MLRDPWVRALAMLGCAIASIYLVSLVWGWLQTYADILLLFFCAWLLAFFLDPLIGALQVRSRLPRVLAVATTYVVLLIVLSLAVIVLVPSLVAQVVAATGSLPTFAVRLADWVTYLQSTANSWLLEHNSPVVFDLRSALTPDEITQRVDALGPPLLSNALQWATGVAALLGELLIVVILSFYFALDGARLTESLITTLPAQAQNDARFLLANVYRVIAGYVRGQVIQALVGGFGTWVLLSAVSVEYALLASAAATLFLLIPFVGPVAAVFIPVGFALLTRPTMAVFVFVVLLILQQVIFNILGPRILSQHVGLHPLLVFFAVLAGARAAGLWGAILGVPLAAVVLAMFSFYRSSHEERLARLRQELPGQPLVPSPAEEAPPEPLHTPSPVARTPVLH